MTDAPSQWFSEHKKTGAKSAPVKNSSRRIQHIFNKDAYLDVQARFDRVVMLDDFEQRLMVNGLTDFRMTCSRKTSPPRMWTT